MPEDSRRKKSARWCGCRTEAWCTFRQTIIIEMSASHLSSFTFDGCVCVSLLLLLLLLPLYFDSFCLWCCDAMLSSFVVVVIVHVYTSNSINGGHLTKLLSLSHSCSRSHLFVHSNCFCTSATHSIVINNIVADSAFKCSVFASHHITRACRASLGLVFGFNVFFPRWNARSNEPILKWSNNTAVEISYRSEKNGGKKICTHTAIEPIHIFYYLLWAFFFCLWLESVARSPCHYWQYGMVIACALCLPGFLPLSLSHNSTLSNRILLHKLCVCCLKNSNNTQNTEHRHLFKYLHASHRVSHTLTCVWIFSLNSVATNQQCQQCQQYQSIQSGKKGRKRFMRNECNT